MMSNFRIQCQGEKGENNFWHYFWANAAKVDDAIVDVPIAVRATVKELLSHLSMNFDCLRY